MDWSALVEPVVIALVGVIAGVIGNLRGRAVAFSKQTKTRIDDAVIEALGWDQN